MCYHVISPAHPPVANTQTHRQDRLQYTSPQLASAQCNCQQKCWKPRQLEQGLEADRSRDGQKMLKTTYRKRRSNIRKAVKCVKDRKQRQTFIRAAPASTPAGEDGLIKRRKERSSSSSLLLNYNRTYPGKTANVNNFSRTARVNKKYSQLP